MTSAPAVFGKARFAPSAELTLPQTATMRALEDVGVPRSVALDDGRAVRCDAGVPANRRKVGKHLLCAQEEIPQRVPVRQAPTGNACPVTSSAGCLPTGTTPFSEASQGQSGRYNSYW